MLLTLLRVRVARAETWYVMVLDEKVMRRPDVAATMHHGPSIGPLYLTLSAEFLSREKWEVRGGPLSTTGVSAALSRAARRTDAASAARTRSSSAPPAAILA